MRAGRAVPCFGLRRVRAKSAPKGGLGRAGVRLLFTFRLSSKERVLLRFSSGLVLCFHGVGPGLLRDVLRLRRFTSRFVFNDLADRRIARSGLTRRVTQVPSPVLAKVAAGASAVLATPRVLWSARARPTRRRWTTLGPAKPRTGKSAGATKTPRWGSVQCPRLRSLGLR